jgi:ATP-binding protein involved in chromosome partitioning
MADDFSLKGDVIDALSSLVDPLSGQSLLDAHVLEQVESKAGVVSVVLKFKAEHTKDQRWQIEDAVAEAAEKVPGVKEARVSGFVEGFEKTAATPGPSAAAGDTGAKGASQPQKSLEGVGRVIAVASGKGGVGKSTVAVNLALALARLGFQVGLLDVDIYGPSVPTLLGVNVRPNVRERRIIPVEAHGLKLMSLGFLMDDDAPVIWRGPIVTGIIRQFLQDVDWRGIDYLIVDMPPGTGDAQLSLAQTVPVDGAVVVTTPSDLALVDAARGLRMFKQLNVDVLGIVENMSHYSWPGAVAARGIAQKLRSKGATAEAEELEQLVTATETAWIFGKGGGEREARRLETEFLGGIPLDGNVRELGDAGRPVVVGDPNSEVTRSFLALAQKITDLKPLAAPGAAPKRGLFTFKLS